MFQTTLVKVLIILFYMIPGYILRKMGKVKSEHLPTLSAILVYIGTPFLVVSSFLSLEFSWEMVKNMAIFFAVTLVLQALFMLAVRLVSGKKRFEAGKDRIVTIGAVMGNVGFFGIPVIKAVLPAYPEVACYAAMYSLSMNILAFTVGAFFITGEKKFMSARAAVFNPTVLGFVIGLPLFFLGLGQTMPAELRAAVDSVSGITTPLCMFILGIRLASARFLEIWTKPSVYVTVALKLLVFPLVSYAAVTLLTLPDSLRWSVLILSGMPCASILLSLSELYESEPGTAANCIFVSTLLCFLTIPVLTAVMTVF